MLLSGVTPTNPLRLVIVDDHAIVRDAVASVIRTHRPQWEICGTASDGREAIARATELRPDIVIMDYKMPELDGLEAAREIGRTLPEAGVLIFTGTDLPYTLMEIFRSKVAGCLLKTEASENLLPAIEAVRLHHRFRSRRLTAMVDAIAASEGELKLLTPREKEAACLIADRKSSKEVAAKLGISVKTVESHRAKIFAKLRVNSTAGLVRHVVRHGWVDI